MDLMCDIFIVKDQITYRPKGQFLAFSAID
jgi:hypothetical protein